MKHTWRDSVVSRQRAIEGESLWRERSAVNSAQGSMIEVGGRSLNNFSSNDYLGFANNPNLKPAVKDAIDAWGIGSGASHLVAGHLSPHHDLEHSLADFVGAERALLFSNGYMANLAVCSAFLGKKDLLLQDKLNHASLIDGAKLSDATAKRYAHANTSHAATLINASEFERVLLATDGVFSMDGDIAPLTDLKQLADANNGLLYVDDAHGFGVMGDHGRGSLNSLNISVKDNILMMGTLGKALGGYGAFVAGDSDYIEHLVQLARPYVYTTALPPAVSATSLAALKLLQGGKGGYQARLISNIHFFREQAHKLKLKVLASPTAIQPIILGSAHTAMVVSQRLREQGFYVAAIRPPTVPKGTARLRVALSASHSQEQISRLLAALKEILLGLGNDH